MSEREFNERAKRAMKKSAAYLSSAREMFDAFLDEMYYETFATEFEKQNPDAYQEQLKSFLDEHSL